ncbi:MAG: hypothetical protein WBG37_18305 [Desulfobacterales bacterium]|jgi:general secretion pathway protein M
MNWADRRRIWIFGGLGLLICLVVFYYLFSSLQARRTRLKRALAAKQQTIAQMHQLRAQYESAMAAAARYRAQISQREQEFTLFSFLDRLAGQAGIKANISYMKPSTTALEDSDLSLESVELKFQAVTLKQITAYLHLLETSPTGALVRRLSLSRVGEDKFYLDAILLVETLVS